MSFYQDKSLFWRYFRDKLRFALVATPGALAVLIHGLARSMDDVRRDILWLRDQFIPPKAEETHIPLHGNSRAVPRTRFDTDARYRKRVERAAPWHKLGGKERGLPVILSDYGFSGGKVHNKRRDNPELWAHFDLKLLNPPCDFDNADVEAVLALANQYKPGRSVIGLIQFASQHNTPLLLGAAAQATIILDHYATSWKAEPPAPAPFALGAASHAYVTIENRIGQS